MNKLSIYLTSDYKIIALSIICGLTLPASFSRADEQKIVHDVFFMPLIRYNSEIKTEYEIIKQKAIGYPETCLAAIHRSIEKLQEEVKSGRRDALPEIAVSTTISPISEQVDIRFVPKPFKGNLETKTFGNDAGKECEKFFLKSVANLAVKYKKAYPDEPKKSGEANRGDSVK